MRRRLLRWSMALALAGALLVAALFAWDMRAAYERVRARGTVIASPYGNIEFTDAGRGVAVLVIHGSGGGYDQGELIARAVLDDDLRRITPSRFGYLRSDLPAAATWDEQAHAYAWLLDHLGIDRVAVVAMSQGGPSALLFALLYPQRVSSLALISCGVAPSATQDQARASEQGDALTAIFRHDALYWVVANAFRSQLMALIGASDEVVAGLTPAQRMLFDEFIDDMHPVSLRAAGVAFDNRTPLPGARIAGIEAPTLILHAADDTLQLFHNAAFAAATIPRARLVRFERGGHFLIGTEQATIREQLREHILREAIAAL
jgi:pimeloyl-ACP methyl ester carboxylesterase